MKKISASEIIIAKLNPLKSAEDYALYGLIDFIYEEFENSIHHYSLAVELSPNEGKFYEQRYNSFFQLGLFEEALSDANKALTINPTAENYVRRGRCLDGLENYKEAILDFNQALILDSSCTDAFKFRGISKALINDTKAAIKDLDIAIKNSNPDTDELFVAYYYRALCYLWSRKFEAALEDFNISIELNTEHALSYEYRGYCNSAFNQLQEVTLDLLRAGKLYLEEKNNESLSRVISRLGNVEKYALQE